MDGCWSRCLLPASVLCTPGMPAVAVHHGAPHPPASRPSQSAEQLRPIWRGLHEQHSYPEFEAEWRRAVFIFSCASRAHLAPPPAGCSSAAAVGSSALPTSSSGSAGSDSPAAPAPHDTPAPMLVD